MHEEHTNKLHVALEDKQFRDYVVTSVEPRHDIAVTQQSTGAWTIGADGWSLLVIDEYGTKAPVVGDTLRVFGEGFGYTVRGIGLHVRDGALLALYRYQTEDESERAHEHAVADSKAKRRAEWEAKKVETAAAIKALPKPFQDRIEFFMRDPAWGPDFGPYELFCCTEAVKIADALGTDEKIIAWHGLGWDEQKAAVPAISGDHSGNTFGTACVLARLYVKDPTLVPKMHGAMCPLVGCKDYGCYSTTVKS